MMEIQINGKIYLMFFPKMSNLKLIPKSLIRQSSLAASSTPHTFGGFMSFMLSFLTHSFNAAQVRGSLLSTPFVGCLSQVRT